LVGGEEYAGGVSSLTITDFETSDRVEHAVFGGELVPLTDAAIRALSLNAELLALGAAASWRSDPGGAREQRPT
jgi:hypothetical protein